MALLWRSCRLHRHSVWNGTPFSGHSSLSALRSRSHLVAPPPTSQSPKLQSWELSIILCLSEISRLAPLIPRPVPPPHESLTNEIFLSITIAAELTSLALNNRLWPGLCLPPGLDFVLLCHFPKTASLKLSSSAWLCVKTTSWLGRPSGANP